MDKNSVPENVMAMFIMLPYVKHFKLEMNLPNITTYEKNTNIKISLISITIYIFIEVIIKSRLHYLYLCFILIFLKYFL